MTFFLALTFLRKYHCCSIHLNLFPDLWCQKYLPQSRIIFLSSYFLPPFHIKHPSIFSSNLDLTCWLPTVVPGAHCWLTGISDWDADMQEERYGGGNPAAGMFSCHSLLLESVILSRCLSWWMRGELKGELKGLYLPLSSPPSTLNPTFDSSLLFLTSPHQTLRTANTLRDLSVLRNDFNHQDERRAAQTWNQRPSLIWLADMQSCLWILVTGENREIMANVSATSWAAGPKERSEEMDMKTVPSINNYVPLK